MMEMASALAEREADEQGDGPIVDRMEQRVSGRAGSALVAIITGHFPLLYPARKTNPSKELPT
ncbi:MAG: hypothetical protein JNM54_01480 [Candidatus Accumulibacter sp.]|jgi:hypothetical protein|nr:MULTISPECIES: hypothetical protein [unclassified Candidatus Accumulibacter]MBL8366579.1 hypothetical protein [Accumulibacter sp.]MBN8514419.1 hypothetical protein [Accumulibacter sp.]MBO3701040.1 hypothetical protein [Accumulibacter sp.]HRE69042.1 hypothetical protein [Accumulibacter sp.]HRI90209.1 hypothetical protein [Accumulibacter sp.]